MLLDLLAIAAHPDDEPSVAAHPQMSSAYKPASRSHRRKWARGNPETRAKEAAKAAKLLRVTWRGTLGVPDSDVQPSRQHKLRLAAVLRQLRPKTVIIPYWEARHPDHYHASTLGYEACFLAGLKQLPLEGEPHRPFKILYATSFADVRPPSSWISPPKAFSATKPSALFASQLRPQKASPQSPQKAQSLPRHRSPRRPNEPARPPLRRNDRRAIRRAFPQKELMKGMMW
jgi:LmbE family N-acetylglucosaminyl deacetylase